MADAPPKSPSGSSHPLLKGLIILLLLGFLGVVGWISWLHYRQDGHVSFRLFDAAWWRPGVDSGAPVIDSARSAGDRAGDALWGDHGLFEQAARWWKERDRAAHDQPHHPPTAPSAEAIHQEQALRDADHDFSEGLAHYQQAEQMRQGTGARDHLLEARAHLLAAKESLEHAVPAYRDAAGHDPDRLADAQALLDYDQRLLTSLTHRLEQSAP